MSFFDNINQGLSDVGYSISSGYNSLKNRVTGTYTPSYSYRPSYSFNTGSYGGKHRSKKYRKGGKTKTCRKGGRKYRSKRRR
jgi:hypothetical protein